MSILVWVLLVGGLALVGYVSERVMKSKGIIPEDNNLLEDELDELFI